MSTSPYMPAANLLKSIRTSRKSLKTLAYTKDGDLAVSKCVYAQVCHVLEHKTTLDEMVRRVVDPAMSTAAKNPELLLVLLYELLLGPNKSIRGGGLLKRQLLAMEDDLRSALQDIQSSSSSNTETSLVSPIVARPMFPRYIRVNTLKASLLEVFSKLRDSGIEVYADEHVPNLLVASPHQAVGLYCHELVKEHKIVLQDKSSCFSALCLCHDAELDNNAGDVLDACAAPGNKTSHLAALIAEQAVSKKTIGKKQRATTIHALDRCPSRFESLKHRMSELIGVTGGNDHQHDKDNNCTHHPHVKVMTHLQDFLQVNPKTDFPTVRRILLDPSCSGSGIVTLPDRWLDTNAGNHHSEEEHVDLSTYKQDGGHQMNHSTTPSSRLQKLSAFQLKALEHAMSFPSVHTIVYSTCSVHEEENEQVVETAMQRHVEWQVVKPNCLTNWGRRGRARSDDTDHTDDSGRDCMIRVDPQEDDTNGFFVCLIVRKDHKSVHSVPQRSKQTIQRSLVPGLDLYKGQFRTPNTKGGLLVKHSQAPGLETGSCSVARKPSAMKPPTSRLDIAKKRAKKLAWKRRQSELKTSRLKKLKSKQEQVASTPT